MTQLFRYLIAKNNTGNILSKLFNYNHVEYKLCRKYPSTRHPRTPSTPRMVAARCCRCTQEVVEAPRTHTHESCHCSLLLRPTHAQETRRQPTSLGMQSLPPLCPMEVCSMPTQLLLFQTVSERQLAHRPQTPLLQTTQVLVECNERHFDSSY